MTDNLTTGQRSYCVSKGRKRGYWIRNIRSEPQDGETTGRDEMSLTDSSVRKEFQARLLHWYERNARSFPWRCKTDPYEILMAELMLQRTQARQVSEVYCILLHKFPDIASLAAASVDEIRQAIHSLGLAHRADTVKKMAIEIMERHDGHIPESLDELLKLPGIGPYAAHALFTYAYGRDVVAVDANVVRLFVRFFGLKVLAKRPHTDKDIWKLAQELVPQGLGKEFNLALLDVSNTVCRTRKPRCDICPLASLCAYYESLAQRHVTEAIVQ